MTHKVTARGSGLEAMAKMRKGFAEKIDPRIEPQRGPSGGAQVECAALRRKYRCPCVRGDGWEANGDMIAGRDDRAMRSVARGVDEEIRTSKASREREPYLADIENLRGLSGLSR
jgi:hypothetical protein